MFLFAPSGRSWDEANPSKGGKVACEACKARVVGGPGVLKGAWSDLREQAAVPTAACRGCVGRARSPKRAAVALVESFKFAPWGWCQWGGLHTPQVGTSLGSFEWEILVLWPMG